MLMIHTKYSSYNLRAGLDVPPGCQAEIGAGSFEKKKNTANWKVNWIIFSETTRLEMQLLSTPSVKIISIDVTDASHQYAVLC